MAVASRALRWLRRALGRPPATGRGPRASTPVALPPAAARVRSRGVAFRGIVWAGGDAVPEAGVVVVDDSGSIAYIGPDTATLPDELGAFGGPGHWVVPGIVDAHVHLDFDPAAGGRAPAGDLPGIRSGVLAVRDLGSPLPSALSWRTGRRQPNGDAPFIAVSGPILTAPGGYPASSWGPDVAEFVADAAQARSAVQRLAAEGVDVVKVALERGDAGWPVLPPQVLRAVVRAAHAAGLAVVAHALTADLVARALDAGVDELAHTPIERLDAELIEQIAASRVSVTSTLQTFFSAGQGPAAAANAADLVAAGVRLRYGTDLGNGGTRPGVDPRELDRLAATGLGRLGALRAATEYAAQAPGIRSRTGRLIRGRAAELVLLPSSPLTEPGVWRTPAAVHADGRLTVNVTGAVRAAAG